MPKLLVALGLAIASVVAHAQVTAEIVFEQEQFLRSESLPLRVRISNFSGQPLRLGEAAEWLVFQVENRDGKALRKSGQIPLPKAFSLESSKSVSLRADLMPYFELSEPGRYTVMARLKLPELQKEVLTESKGFDVISGTKLWEREFGVPGGSPPEVRKYALQQAAFLKQICLYVRVTDQNEGTVFNVVRVGQIVSFATPETQLDRSSNLHVLVQDGARTFLYAVVSPDGQKIIQQTHEQANTRPHLRVEDDGRIIVNGGRRKVLLSDLPPPRVANSDGTIERK
jgi:hypothetical protein